LRLAQGRLIAILLTGGEAHECPIAERLIRRVKRPKRMLGDKAYDSAELRGKLDRRGTKTRHSQPLQQKAAIPVQQTPLQVALAHRGGVQQIERLPPHRNAL
jgi:transposase